MRALKPGERKALEMVGLVASCVAAGRIGPGQDFVRQSLTAIWLPSGICLAALLVRGLSLWPAVLIGSLLSNFMATASWPVSISIAAGNLLETLLGVWLVNRYAGGKASFDRYENFFRFIVLAGLLSSAAGSAIGAAALVLAKLSLGIGFGSVWLTWWAGDVLGDISVAPLLILWTVYPRKSWSLRQGAEASLVLATLFLLARVVFGTNFGNQVGGSLRAYLCIPPLVWTAFRFGRRETALALSLVAFAATRGTLSGMGPFISNTPGQSLLLLQLFMGISSVMVMSLAVVVWERKVSEAALKKLHAELEQRVQDRTEDLSRASQSLEAAIDQRRWTEAALRQSQELFQILVEGVKDYAIIMLSPEGDIMTWNKGAQAITGYSAHEIIGRNFSQFFPPQDAKRNKPQKILDRARATGRVEEEGWRVRKDGAKYLASVVLTVIRDDADKLVGFAKVTRDVTLSKQVEEAEALRTKEALQRDFVANVSHELRTPLAVIKGSAETLRLWGLNDPKERVKLVSTIEFHADLLARLVEDILKLSSAESGKRPYHPEPIALSGFVEHFVETISSLAARNRISLHVKIPQQIRVLVDKILLGQVLQCLCENAIEYNRAGGQVEISARLQAEEVLVSVRDTGIGIPKADLPLIFERFHRAPSARSWKPGGTGLGLSIAKSLVESFGGRIWAESPPGNGAVFKFTLALTHEEAAV